MGEHEEGCLVLSCFLALRSLAIARLHCFFGHPPRGIPLDKPFPVVDLDGGGFVGGQGSLLIPPSLAGL